MPDLISVIDNALPPETCAAWIEAFEQSEHRSVGETGGGVDLSKKRSTDIVVSKHREFGELLRPVYRTTTSEMQNYFRQHPMAMIGGLGLSLADPSTGEVTAITHDNFSRVAEPQLPRLMQSLFRIGDINAQKYDRGSGGYTYWHSEVYPESPHNDALHRILLFMFYLNDVEQGGETEFLYQQQKVAPRAGRMVIAPAYFTHTHCGHVPESHDKYILTSWILFQRAEQIYRPQ